MDGWERVRTMDITGLKNREIRLAFTRLPWFTIFVIVRIAFAGQKFFRTGMTSDGKADNARKLTVVTELPSTRKRTRKRKRKQQTATEQTAHANSN
jgi:hypothetical protein